MNLWHSPLLYNYAVLVNLWSAKDSQFYTFKNFSHEIQVLHAMVYLHSYLYVSTAAEVIFNILV